MSKVRITIIVEDDEQKDVIVDMLIEAEENGDIDFPFLCKADDFDGSIHDV